MWKIGLTGNIGSGKSTVAHLLRLMSVPLYNCDKEAKRIMECDEGVHEQIISLLGEECYNEEGRLLSHCVAECVFANEQMLARLNEIVHPAVKEDFLLWSANRKEPVVAMESAILFESGFQRVVDVTVTVWASEECSLARAAARDGTPKEEIKRRWEHQMAQEEKIRRADFAICNDHNLAILPQTMALMEYIALR